MVLAGGTPEQKAAAIAGMRGLNRVSSEALQALGGRVHAVTDVTGFGLAGHGWEMAERSGVRLCLDTRRLPLYPGAEEIAASGTRTGGDARNRQYLNDQIESATTESLDAIAFDPQTSGGLLAAVDPDVLPELEGRGFWEIGEVFEGSPTVELR
jgi:selenide,water dikinase